MSVLCARKFLTLALAGLMVLAAPMPAAARDLDADFGYLGKVNADFGKAIPAAAFAVARPADATRGAAGVGSMSQTARIPTPALAATGFFYFHGTPQDQANKQAIFTDPTSRGTATFDQMPPTGGVPVTQTGSPFANDDFVGNPLAIFWRGPFTGTVNGVIDLEWFWSTTNAEAIALGETVEVTIFADPEYSAASRVQPQHIIGRALVRLTGLSASPTLISSIVPVSGTVASELLIQVVPHFVDSGQGLFVYYDAVSTPSNFRFLDTSPFQVPPPAPQGTGLPPRFQNFTPTAAQTAAGMGIESGEPSIGVNWNTGKVFYQSFIQTLRETFNDTCPTTPSAIWEDKSSILTNTSQDPILYTDSRTGRTIVSQLVFGTTESRAAFTDNDGDVWLPSQGAGFASGIDHQTLGGGPFHAPIPTGAAYPNAVYYCAQAIATANCALSLDGGITFGPAVPIYTSSQCGGLHGHVKVGPDGTVYVPNKSCGTGQAVVVSENNGATWDVRAIPGSLPSDSDPSVAVDKGGRAYFGYANNNNHPVVAVSDDQGRNWTNIFDVGGAFGINNVVFPAVVAGDAGRAAFAFLGTLAAGDLQAQSFKGVWHLYIATTYDGGNSWITVDATPNDPVQRGPIWLKGGSVTYRNLLDFMDATIDAQGRVLMAYADGCAGACTQAPPSANGNGYTQLAGIARQAGGRRMFAQFDPAEPTVPGAPAVTVTRNGALARLTWSESNNGGSPVTNYRVLRGTASGQETLLANVGTATSFDDFTIDPNATYFYRVVAVNALGRSCGSNEVPSAPAGSSCVLPGITVVTDPTGDQVGAPLNSGLDIQSISVAEPFFADGSSKLVFTMKVASLSTVPANGQWRIFWFYPTAPQGIYYVGMTSDASSNVAFEYGTVAVTSAVVAAIPQTTMVGVPDAGTFSADGTITITIANSKVGNPGLGDLLGSTFGRTFLVTGSATTRSTTAIDSTSSGDPYILYGNAFCAPPLISSCIEDNDPRISFGNGWHLLSDPNASAGHFRVHFGQDTQQGASLAFDVPSGNTGAIIYNFAKSPKGGTAEVLIDGVSKGIVSFQGLNGLTRHPQFGFSIRYGNIASGHHTFTIHPLGGAVYLDSLCLQNATAPSSPPPPAHPGNTDEETDAMVGSQQLIRTITVPTGALSISAVAEAAPEVPVQIVLLDPLGTVLGTADNASGFATIDAPVSAGGVYLLRVTNVSLGSVSVWTAATSLVTP